MESFADIIGLWPTAEALGSDIGETGLVVRAWKRRNNIPSEHWAAIIRAAGHRGFVAVTADLLTDLAARRAAA